MNRQCQTTRCVRTWLKVGLLGLACCLVGRGAAAQARTVKVSFYRYGGCHEMAADGTRGGYGYDFYELLAAETGWKIEYVGYDRPWGDMLGMLERGELDIVDFVCATPERAKKLAFSRRPTAYSGCSLRTLPRSVSRFPTGRFADWGTVRVGVMAGDNNVTELRHFAADRNICVEVREYRDEPLAVAALERGEIDMVAFDGFAPQMGLATIENFAPARNHLAVRKADVALLRELDAAMAAFDRRHPDWMMNLRKKYFPTPVLAAYVPENYSVHMRNYVRDLLRHLSEVNGEEFRVKTCPMDFAGVDFSVPSCVCGVPYGMPDANRFAFPQIAAGRRRADLLCRADDARFTNGLSRTDVPLRVGVLDSQRQLRGAFERFAVDKGHAFRMVTVDSASELERRLTSGQVDIMLKPASPNPDLPVAASCGYVDFFLAVPTNHLGVAHDISEGLKYLRLSEPAFIQELEARHFATGNDDARLVRLGAYDERGLSERGEDGLVHGLVVDYVDRVAKRCGWNVETILMSYPEAQRALAEGSIDLMGAAIWTPERAKVYDYSKFDIGPLHYALMKRSDGRMLENRPHTWMDAKIGVMSGSKAVHDLERHLAARQVTWTPIAFNTLVDAENELRRGRLDAVYTLVNSKNRDLVPLAMLPTELCYFCSNTRKPWIKRELDAAVEAITRENSDFLHDLTLRHLSTTDEAITLDVDEIDFVRERTGRGITVGFTAELPPLVTVDEKTGAVGGFYRQLFERFAAKTGLAFEFLKPGEPAEVVVVQNGAVPVDDRLVIDGNWLQSPGCWVLRRGSDDRGLGRVAVQRHQAREIGFVRGCGFTPIPFDTREECYRAVEDGRVEKLLDNFAVARYRIDELKTFDDLVVQRIDMAAYHRRIAMYTATEADPRLRSILAKARDALSPEEFDSLLFDSIYRQRLPVMKLRTVLKIIGVLLVLMGVVAFLIHHRAALKVRHERELNEVMARERKKAEVANASKTVFLSSMSHDIRTPMNAILGFAGMASEKVRSLSGKVRGDELAGVADSLEKIGVSGRHLLQLINEVLDMSRIESGRIELHPERTDVSVQFESLGVICGETASDKGVALAIDTSAVRHRHVVVDAVRLNQVMLNVVGNAIKYTSAGGRVDVVLAEEAAGAGRGRYVARVRDTGIGMGEDFLKNAFEPFAREQTATESGIEGTGLGLAIVKKIVDLLGGRIDIASEPGKGTVVTVALELEIVPEEKVDSAPGGDAVPEVGLAGRRVLLVEDNAMNREIARYVLEANGIAVDEAVNGAEAVEKVTGTHGEAKAENVDSPYDWVLMDIQMPVMNGYEATRLIRQWESTSQPLNLSTPQRLHLPIIAMTANAFAEDRRLAREAGMDGHLAKPIVVGDLVKALRAALRR